MAPHGTNADQKTQQSSSQVEVANTVLARSGSKAKGQPPEVQTAMNGAGVNSAADMASDSDDELEPEVDFEHPRYQQKSAAKPPTCTSRCTICVRQWLVPEQTARLPYGRSFTDEQAAQQVTELLTATANNLNYTRTFVDKHGNSIVKAWKKRSPAQRKDIIRQSMPDVVPRRDFLGNKFLKRLRKTGGRARHDFAAKYHNSLLLPYLDVETMSQEANILLAMLYQRTRSKPSDLVPFDDAQLDFSFKAPVVRVTYNTHCVQMHSGNYGQLISWAKEAAHRSDMIGFPRAFLIFQAQHQLSTILRQFVDSVVSQQSIPATIRGRDQLDSLASSGFVDESKPAARQNYPSSYMCPPPKLDMADISWLFITGLMAAEDELWLMQTDPGYLQRHLSPLRGAIMFEACTFEEFQDFKAFYATMPMAIWESWHRLAIEVAETTEIVLSASKGLVKPGKPLPEEYEVTLAGFERALLEEFDMHCTNVMTIVLCSNTFRNHSPGAHGGLANVRAGADTANERDPLFYHLAQLARYDERRTCPATYHLLMLEKIIENSKDQAARVDQILLDVLTIMSVIDAALVTIRAPRPRARPFEQVSHLPRAVDYDARKRVFDAGKEAQHTHLPLLYGTLENLLRMPPRPRNASRDALRILDESHEALQLFWQAVRERWSIGPWGRSMTLGVSAIAKFCDNILRTISFSVSPEYLENVQAERSCLLATIEAQEKRVAAARAVAAAKLDVSTTLPQRIWGQETAENFRPLPEKYKLKTRPVQPSAHVSSAEHSDIKDTTDALDHLTLRVRVGPASYDIFHRMFDTRSENQSNIRWEDFVAAMVDAGFSVTPSGGSILTFKNVESGGSINFHRPHPDPSIDPIMLRVMGRRLNKWFKFDKDTFVESQKEMVASVKDEA